MERSWTSENHRFRKAASIGGVLVIFLVVFFFSGSGIRHRPSQRFLFTSESVTEGHSDKICDQVIDAVLDAALKQDPDAAVSCEAVTEETTVMAFGKVTANATINYTDVIRSVLSEIGYADASYGIDYKTCNAVSHVVQHARSPTPPVPPGNVTADDQGLMFGYATDETEELMPLSYVLATALVHTLASVRKNGSLPWLRPDAKAQVTVEYETRGGGLVPLRVHTVVVSTQHAPSVALDQVRTDIEAHVVRRVIPVQYVDVDTAVFVNPGGPFLFGGPHRAAGLSGRKLAVDTYGGWGGTGGGALSGKDASHLDRTGTYAARWVAKSLVASGLAQRVLVQISYSIGHADPLAVNVDSYGTGKYADSRLVDIVLANFDLRPGVLVEDLQLKRPTFSATSTYGHFGRTGDQFTWERPRILT